MFDISTPELLKKVYVMLFRERAAQNYYDDLQEIQSALYTLAMRGEDTSEAARKIINFRNREGYEYEHVEEIDVE